MLRTPAAAGRCDRGGQCLRRGREGELIFRTVYCLAGCTKPMKTALDFQYGGFGHPEGFANLRPGADYDGAASSGPLPCQGGLVGGHQCHPAVFRCCTTGPSTSGVSCPRHLPLSSSVRPRSTPSSRCPVLHSHAGAARFFRFVGAHGRPKAAAQQLKNGLPGCGCHGEKGGAQRQVRKAARPL